MSIFHYNPLNIFIKRILNLKIGDFFKNKKIDI